MKGKAFNINETSGMGKSVCVDCESKEQRIKELTIENKNLRTILSQRGEDTNLMHKQMDEDKKQIKEYKKITTDMHTCMMALNLGLGGNMKLRKLIVKAFNLSKGK